MLAALALALVCRLRAHNRAWDGIRVKAGVRAWILQGCQHRFQLHLFGKFGVTVEFVDTVIMVTVMATDMVTVMATVMALQ